MGGRNFTCKICGNTIWSLPMLRRHVAAHESDVPDELREERDAYMVEINASFEREIGRPPVLPGVPTHDSK